jgi:hypothetical protein
MLLGDPSAHPEIVGSVEPEIAAIGGEDAFEYGLERILDGLEATLHRVASLP